jgi:hypothetical protein
MDNRPIAKTAALFEFVHLARAAGARDRAARAALRIPTAAWFRASVLAFSSCR